jgi:hypothetical protein
MPRSNSLAAKHVRCVAIMAFISRTYNDLLFHPIFVFGKTSACRDALTRQASINGSHEAAVRSLLLGMLKEEQAEAGTLRVRESCELIMAFVSGLLAPKFESEFREHLITLTESALATWQQITRQQQSFEARFDEDFYSDWAWQELRVTTDQLETKVLESGASHRHGPVALVVFPRLYLIKDDEEDYPESHGVLLLESQLREAQEVLRQIEADQMLQRRDSAQTRTPRARRVSLAASATPPAPSFLGPAS